MADLANITGIETVFLLQPLPVTNGTNILGLPVDDTTLVLGATTAGWTNAEDDEAVLSSLFATKDAQVKILTDLGLSLPFIYLNYANPPQDALGSYGAENKALMNAASKKYDPNSIFQIAASGGWKLANSPSSPTLF
jgi:hypothetical protein